MGGTFVFLGTGSSMGVPVIGCSCQVCQSSDTKNKRMRAAALIKVKNKTFLIDAGPDFRSQAFLYNIHKIDGFILTHAHYDHAGGFDDVKAYKQTLNKKVPCLMSRETFSDLKYRYHYLFKPLPEDPFNSSFFSWSLLDSPFGDIDFEGLSFKYVSYFQAGMKVLGIRIGNLAYISDIKQYEDQLIEELSGVEVLIISALKETGSEMHFSVEEAVAFSKKVRAQKTYLTHIAHEMDYQKMQESLPSNVFLAYDGMTLAFDGQYK